MEWMSKLGEERDYKDEYKKFQSSTKSKKYRAELNKYNRKKGTYGNGDGKDASHKGGKIVGFESESKNRGRAEKSRLKKEGMLNENPAAMAAASAMVKIKMKNPKTGKESSAASALKNKDNPNHKKAKGIFGKLKDRFAKKKKEEPKKQSKADGDFYKRQYEAKNTPEIFEKYRTILVVAFRKAGILVKKIKPMKKGFTNAAFGVFFDVKAANGSDTIPIYIDKKGMVELGVSSKGFVIGRIDQMAKMIKNLKDFKKSDLDESVNEAKDPDVIAQIRGVLKKGYSAVKDPVSGKKMKMDTYTASAITQVYDAINTSNKKKFSKLSILKMQNVAFKVIKK
jgi:hypothetical protein